MRTVQLRAFARLITVHRADTAASGGYVPVIGALSFITWYRPIYLGFKKTEGRAMAFFICKYRLRCLRLANVTTDVFLFFGGWNLLFAIYMAIGIPCKELWPPSLSAADISQPQDRLA